MRRAVVVILDGLRRDFVDAARTPRLASFAAQAENFPGFRTAFPSATRAVSASFATGCHPARHTLQGNAVALLENGALVPHDVGRPGFLAHKRSVTGHALAVPTLAERSPRMAERSCSTTSRPAPPTRMTRTRTATCITASSRAARAAPRSPIRCASRWTRRATGR